jgi:hypothetical protein
VAAAEHLLVEGLAACSRGGARLVAELHQVGGFTAEMAGEMPAALSRYGLALSARLGGPFDGVGQARCAVVHAALGDAGAAERALLAASEATAEHPVYGAVVTICRAHVALLSGSPGARDRAAEVLAAARSKPEAFRGGDVRWSLRMLGASLAQ